MSLETAIQKLTEAVVELTTVVRSATGDAQAHTLVTTPATLTAATAAKPKPAVKAPPVVVTSSAPVAAAVAKTDLVKIVVALGKLGLRDKLLAILTAHDAKPNAKGDPCVSGLDPAKYAAAYADFVALQAAQPKAE